MDSLVDPADDILLPPWGSLGRDLTLGLVSGLCKLWLFAFNTTAVHGRDRLMNAVYKREAGHGLITVCNHTSTIDDPVVFSAVLPWSLFWSEHQHGLMRWSMCAREFCFSNELISQFFLNGKVLPIDRGQGVDQPIMAVATRRVQAGDWMHVFAEGRINHDGRLGPFKWGVGKMVCDARLLSGRDPLVIPFYHSGISRILPKGAMIPRVGHNVTVAVGGPVELADLTCNCNVAGVDQQMVWRQIAQRMHSAMKELEESSPPNWDQLAGKAPARSGDNGDSTQGIS